MAASGWRGWVVGSVLLVLALAWIGGVTSAVEFGARHSWLFWLEHWTGDWRTMLLSDRPRAQHPKIAVVKVTDGTLQQYPYRIPVDRGLVARLVRSIDAAGAEAIAIDFLFLKATEPEKDDELRSAIRQANARVVIAVADSRVELSASQRDYQAEFLQSTAAMPGFANLLTGGDRIVRFIAPPVDEKFSKSFAVAAAKPEARMADGPRRIAWLLRPGDGNDRFFELPAHVLASPAGQPPPAAAAALSRLLKGKVVFIGADLVDVDRHLTPLPSWEKDDEMAGVMIHAQVAAQLLDGRRVVRVDKQILRFVYAILASIGLWIGLRYGTSRYSFYFGTTTLALAVVDIALFTSIRQFLPFGACLAALIAGLVGGILLRRLIPFLDIALRANRPAQ